MRVSVIVPCYNHGPYITQAISSVLDQGWPEIDLIVIDDGSRDNSAEIIRGLHESRGGFRFFTRGNRGLLATLHELVELAKGDALCVLASDDYLPPGSLARRAQFLIDHPECSAVFGDGLVVRQGRKQAEPILSEKQRNLFSLADPIPEFLRGTNLPVHTMMVRTDAFRRIGGFDQRYRRCEDLDVQLLLFLQGKVGLVDFPVYCYREHETNTSRVNRQVARVDKVLCYKKYLEEIPALHPYRKLIRYRLRRQFLLLARHLRQVGGGSRQERELAAEGWKMAWQDPRLLWHLTCLRVFAKEG